MLAGWEKNRKLDLADTLERTQRRLNAIQKWLGFTDAILDRWKMLAGQFLTFLAEGAKKKSITREDIADNYPIVWANFLRESNNEDDFMSKMVASTGGGGEDIWKQLNEMKIDGRRKRSEQHQQGRAAKTKQPSDLEVEDEIDPEGAEDPDEDA